MLVPAFVVPRVVKSRDPKSRRPYSSSFNSESCTASRSARSRSRVCWIMKPLSLVFTNSSHPLIYISFCCCTGSSFMWAQTTQKRRVCQFRKYCYMMCLYSCLPRPTDLPNSTDPRPRVCAISSSICTIPDNVGSGCVRLCQSYASAKDLHSDIVSILNRIGRARAQHDESGTRRRRE